MEMQAANASDVEKQDSSVVVQVSSGTLTFQEAGGETLREKLAYIRQKMDNENEEVDGDLPNEKGKRPFDIKAKYRKIMRAMTKVNDDIKLRDEIVAFKYATDMSILRRASPDEVWTAVKRRAAWAQGYISSLVYLDQYLFDFFIFISRTSQNVWCVLRPGHFMFDLSAD